MKKSVPAFALALLLVSCAKEPFEQTPGAAPAHKVRFTAQNEMSGTKTALVDGTSVYWQSGDAISIFDGSANVRSVASQAGPSASFDAMVTGDGPWYAIYPYREGNVVKDGVITTVLPSKQLGYPGTFAPGLNLSVAYSTTNDFYFKNVVGFVKIVIGQDLIRQISIKGIDGDTIAGTLDISWNDGTPSFTLKDEIDEIILAPASGEYFQAGQAYYAAVLPGTLDGGFSLEYTDAFNDTYEVSSSNPPTFKRSVVTNLGTPDSRFLIDGPISFACPAVKADLLASDFGQAKFGNRQAGEIYKSEAASVTYADLNAYACVATGTKLEKVCAASTLWSDAAAITSFDELKYFVGLYKTDLSNPEYRLPTIFSQCVNLTSVKFPYNLSTIEAGSFQGCTSITTLEFPENYRAVFGYTFAQSGLTDLNVPKVTAFSNYACMGSALKTVTVSEACTSIGEYAFQNCTSMTKFNIPASPQDCKIETIGQYAFDGCKSMSFASRNFKHLTTIGQYAFQNTKIKNITMSSITSIGRNAFYGCTSLVDVFISKELTEIPQYCFAGCKAMTGFTYVETNKANGIELPEGLTTIGTAAFGGCTKIKRVVMPSTVTSLGKNIFRSQKTDLYVDLESWTVKAANVPALGENTFLINNTSRAGTVAKILVPAESVAAYKAATNWSAFSSVIEGMDITSASAELTVKGASVDVRTWGLTGGKHSTVFPLDLSPQTTFAQVTGALPTEIYASRYATSFKTVVGIESVKATAATTVTIATPALLSASTGWTETEKSMTISGTEYYFYTKPYTAAQATAGEWMPIPGKTGYSTLVFNTAGDIKVDCPAPPVTIIDKVRELRTFTINHPTIVKLPDGSILTAQTNGSEYTPVYRSTDGGATWAQYGTIPGENHYGGLHSHNGAVYLLGTDAAGGNIVISKSTDKGKTWSAQTILFKNWTTEDEIGYHCAPSPWFTHEGRVYRAFSAKYAKETRQPWGTLFISAPVDSDYMDPNSWTMSNVLLYDNYVPTMSSMYRGEEPCVFSDKDGNLKIMLRLDDSHPYEFASIFNITDFKTLEYVKTIIMPGAAKKFQIYWDEQSRKYWSVVSPSFWNDMATYGTNACNTRNAYSLVTSTDLENWTIEHTCIYSDNAFSNSYHYIDWAFDGDDIISCFRCSFDEERGMAYSGHDSNGFGFFRVRNFRNAASVPTILVDTPVSAGAPVVPSSYR